jgi:hypothetical protein
MPSTGTLRRVAPVTNDVSKERSASFGVTRIVELRTTLAVTIMCISSQRGSVHSYG